MQKSHYINLRRNKIRSRLREILGGKCCRCFVLTGLEFDHINPKEKLFQISSGLDKPWDILLQEVKKCQLLCKKCHREKTKEDKPQLEHGTLSKYTHDKCRCQKCTIANREYKRNYSRVNG